MQLDIRLGKARHFPLQLHWSWIPFFGVVAWLLASRYLPAAYPGHYSSWYRLAAIAMCMAGLLSLLLHEIGHLVVAIRYRIPVSQVVLFPFGGVTHFTEVPRGRHAILFGLSGPLSSTLLALLLAALGFLLAEPAVLMLALFNTAVAVFNLLPGEPLDGARLLRSRVSPSGPFRVLNVATFWIGHGISAILIWSGGLTLLLGYYRTDGLLLILLGYILQRAHDVSSMVDEQQERRLLKNLSVGDFVTHLAPPGESTGRHKPHDTLPAGWTRSAIDNITPGGSDGAFLEIKPRSSLTPWSIPVDAPLSVALQKMDVHRLSSLLMVDQHRVVATCSREDILRYVQQQAESRAERQIGNGSTKRENN